MKNIEKYPNTDAALEAWKKYNSGRSIGLHFSDWLDEEFEPHEPTLLEAAERVIDCLYRVRNMSEGGSLSLSYDDVDLMKEALVREKRKPIRNLDRYATAEEAAQAFDEKCKEFKSCDECPVYARIECQFKWLYAEADKEEKE